MAAGVLAGVGLLVLAAVAWRAIEAWRSGVELSQANREVASGRLGPARERLARLSDRWPGWAEVEYQLGVCEQGLGHPEAALAAWSRVPSGTPAAVWAAVLRAQTLMQDCGQFAAAESILEPACWRTDVSAAAARRLLAQLLHRQGRFVEVRRLLEQGWYEATDRRAALRELWLLDAEPPSVGDVQALLDRAPQEAPDDDRVWLARANLATQSGRFAEAARWLDACLRRRPDDPAVWRARLSWACAVPRADAAVEALTHLKAERFDPAEILVLGAWFAARRGDSEAERQALERLIDRNPGETRALDRLVALAVESGQAGRAAELRRRKADVDAAQERYRALLAGGNLIGGEPELARLADALGRRFEARCWTTLAGRRATRDRGVPAPPPTGPTLADLLADLDRFPAPARSPASAPPASAPPKFRDDAEAAGLRFTYDNGRTPAHQLPETMGGGVALLDYDGDGWLDVFCVQGGPFPPRRTHPGDRLFRNQGDGRFEEATASAGLTGLAGGYGHGVAVGDYDNDGRPDLFVTRWRRYTLYRNRGDGRFEDVTAAAGLGGDRDWPTSAAFADLDGDGDLDLYVCHYLAWDADRPRPCRGYGDTADPGYCHPRDLEALPDHVFRNDGGRFVDATAEAGFVDHEGRGLGVVANDLDGDGRVDLFIANDTTANALERNLGGFRFEETASVSGVAASAAGGYQAGMGVACGDLDGDGRPDLAVTNFYGESTTFYRNLGGGLFADHTAAVGLAAPSRYLLGFGIAFLDVNNDGWLDLATANGHVNDHRPHLPHAMPAQLLAGAGGGRLIDVSDGAGPPWSVPRLGRGLAAGDLDNDGRVDLLVVDQGAPLAYLHNQTAGGHFVTFRLEGTTSNRDAVAARVTITADGRRRVAWRIGGGSYQSASDPRLHFGLGSRDGIEDVEVVWPSGQVDRHRDLRADGGYLLREGDAEPRPLDSFARANVLSYKNNRN